MDDQTPENWTFYSAAPVEAFSIFISSLGQWFRYEAMIHAVPQSVSH